MQLSLLMNKYSVKSEHVDAMTESVVNDERLSDIAKKLDNAYTCEQVFALCRAISAEILDADINAIAPNLVSDRNRIAQKSHARWARERKAASERRRAEQERKEQALMQLLASLEDDDA